MLVQFCRSGVIYSFNYWHALATTLGKCGTGHTKNVSNGHLRHLLFFPKWARWQICPRKFGTRCSEVNSLPWAEYIWYFQTGFGAGVSFLWNGCWDKCVRPSLGHNTGQWGPCYGLQNVDFSRRPSAHAFVFSEKGVGGKMFPQTLGSRQASGVLAMG